MIRAFLLLSFVFLASCARTTTPTAEVIDIGLYDAVIVTSGNWQLKPPVEIAAVHQLKHVKGVTRIPAEDGRYWGLRARLTNPTNQPVDFRYVIEHPEFTTPQGKTSIEEVEEFSLPPGHSEIHEFLWYFIESCEFEFVPGTWTRRLFLDGKEVVRQEFDIYKPE